MYKIYLFVAFIVLLLIRYAYLRLKYGFWYYQPVFHAYDFWYYFFPCGIIQHELPNKNRFTNTDAIEMIYWDNISESTSDKCVDFLQKNHLKNDGNEFKPEKQNIIKYFTGHSKKTPCFLSLYWKDEWTHNPDEIVKDKKLIGMATARPLYIKFKKDEQSIVAYYVDYLCIHKDYRKKGYAPQIIETFYYNQRRATPNIHVSLFKRENVLTGIVPLCVYSTYGFSMKGWKKPLEIPSSEKIVECSSQNIKYVVEFMRETESSFAITISPEIINILELLQSRNIYIYFTLNSETNTIMSVYFFRNTCVSLEKDCKILNCFASICREKYSDEAFAYGFKCAIFMIPMMDYLFLTVEDTSHNKKLIDNLQIKNKATLVSPAAYFFYNFAHETFPSNKVLVIS